MERADRPRRSRTAPLLCVVVAVTLSVHLRNLFDFFLSDDFLLLHRALAEPFGAWLLWPDAQRSTWFRPMVDASWRLATLAFGTAPVGHHAINLALHVVNSVLVFRITRQATSSLEAATAAACLFGAGALSPNAVAWLSARFDVMATTFALAAVTLVRAPRGRASGVLLPLVCLGAVLSKESAFVLPLVLILAIDRDGCSEPQGLRAWWRPLGIAFVAMAAVFVMRLVAFRGLGGYGRHATWSLSSVAVPFALWPLTFQPLQLFPLVGSKLAGWVAIGLIGLVLSWRDARWSLCALICLVPVSNLLPDPRNVTVFEAARFIYLPSAFACIGVATALGRFRGSLLTAMRALILLAGTLSWWHASGQAEAWRRAALVSARVDVVLDRERERLPSDTAVDCSELPDNIDGAYVYRNDCDDHVGITVRRRDVRGVRVLPGIRPDPVSEGLDRFAHVLRFTADGSRLVQVR